MFTETPNQALQRTAPVVTLAAPPPSPTQPSRQPPPSLSLGSLGHMSTHLFRLFVCIILAWSPPCRLFAHEDANIRLEGTKLVGLPEDYSPAELDMKTWRLRIGKHAITIPQQQRNLFEQSYNLQISASWYHGPSGLPPYMAFNVQPNKRDFRFEMIVNLKTLELVGLSIIVKLSDSEERYWPLAFDGQWKAAIKTLK